MVRIHSPRPNSSKAYRRSHLRPGSEMDPATPLGLITVGLARLISWLHRMRDAVEPFPSVRSLFAVRRSCSSFIRRRYPQALTRRKVRGPVVRVLLWLYELALVAVLSPVVLLIQALPERGKPVHDRGRLDEVGTGCLTRPGTRLRRLADERALRVC